MRVVDQGLTAAVCGCLLAVSLGALRVPPDPANDIPDQLEGYARWDGGWYGSIVRDGYWYKPGKQSPVAFFPGYPMLVRAVSAVGLNRWVAATLVTLVCGIAAVLIFSRWSKLVSPASSDLATWLLIFYPFSFFLYGIVYSDALFLLLAVGAFFCVEKGRPGWAGIIGALATATRPIAPALVLGLWLRHLELRRRAGASFRATDLLPLVAALGLVAYMGFLEVRFDDELAFAHVQGAPGWDQAPGPRTWFKLTLFESLSKVSIFGAARLLIHAALTLAALALVPATKRVLGWGYAVYVAAAVGIPAIGSKDFHGLGRYLIAAFPLFVVIATLLANKPRLRRAWLVGSAASLLLLAAGFGAGEYIA
jgi:hypothetical protein